MSRLAIAAAFVIVASISDAASAADLKIPPPPTPPQAQISSPMQANQPSCIRWTDDCVNCMRGAEGAAPVCSNIGFACQPNAIRCLAP